jgi:diguanylate cyclase (GGDEF)-like protein
MENAKLKEELVAEKNKNEGLHEHMSKMKEIVYTDAMTNVKNRTAYEKRLETLDMHAENTPDYAIVMMDANHLKLVNDKYGHEHGNEYIKGCCRMFCEVYVHSPVYRIGGDEFVAVLNGSDYESRDQLLAELKQNFRESSSREGVEPWEQYSAATGMAVHQEGEDAKTVFNRADKTMYEEKIAMHTSRE